MSKKIISLMLVCVTVAAIFCSCAKTDKDKDNTTYTDKGNAKIVKISLPYSSSDSLNPYFAQGNENLALSYIFCRPLFTVKSNYSSEPIVADSFSIREDRIDISINPMMFSDGSAVTADDIVYSFDLAKKSIAFSQRLRNIDKAVANSSGVTFTLKSPDKLAANVLTFPIVKRGTADKSENIPTGSGVFMFSGREKLTINPYSQTISSINTVELCDIKTLELAVSELEIGNINYLFEDFSEGVFKGIVAENKSVTLNNLVYLGINGKNSVLSSAAVRTAIYYAINKDNASATPYQGYAVAAATPFNPDFYELKSIELPDVKGDKAKARSIIEKLGYNYDTKGGAKSNSEYDLSFTLIVNKNNPFRVAAANKIAEELNECGFKIEVARLDTENYKQRISDGEYQLCIGEVKLPENMDLYAFYGGFFKESFPERLKFFNDYSSYKAGEIDMNTLVNSYLNDVPFVPICYRVGMAAYTKSYSPDFTYAPFDIYGNIENWEAVK